MYSVKKLAKLAYYYAPDTVKQHLQEWAQQRELKHAQLVARRTRVTKEQVQEALSQFTFDSDVMLHSSMIKIGKIQGGAKYLAESIVQAVDISRHTLLVSALPYRGLFATWLNDEMTFDVRTAPIAMGVVNEKIAAQVGAVRSVHPTHSVVALGPKAVEYTQEHQLCQTPFGEKSPYFKLIINHAKILLFGATLNNMTFNHAIEDALGNAYPARVYNKRTYRIRCIDAQGNEVYVATPVHNPVKSIIREWPETAKVLEARGGYKTIPLGESSVSLVDCYEYTMAYLDYLASGHSLYGLHRVTPQLLERIEQLKALVSCG
ncbi:MAG: AAC(3) family N-acetyltransferase [Muribaculaceae bacterium]|nr:AAC(3) family N-acetyltransferase [Muribaculaceae bacterium]